MISGVRLLHICDSLSFFFLLNPPIEVNFLNHISTVLSHEHLLCKINLACSSNKPTVQVMSAYCISSESTEKFVEIEQKSDFSYL